MIRVRFTRGFRMYQAGEIAGFDAEMAGLIVKDGFAVLVDGAEDSGPGDTDVADADPEPDVADSDPEPGPNSGPQPAKKKVAAPLPEQGTGG